MENESTIWGFTSIVVKPGPSMWNMVDLQRVKQFETIRIHWVHFSGHRIYKKDALWVFNLIDSCCTWHSSLCSWHLALTWHSSSSLLCRPRQAIGAWLCTCKEAKENQVELFLQKLLIGSFSLLTKANNWFSVQLRTLPFQTGEELDMKVSTINKDTVPLSKFQKHSSSIW